MSNPGFHDLFVIFFIFYVKSLDDIHSMFLEYLLD